ETGDVRIRLVELSEERLDVPAAPRLRVNLKSLFLEGRAPSARQQDAAIELEGLNARQVACDTRNSFASARFLESIELGWGHLARAGEPRSQRDVDHGHELVGISAGAFHQPHRVELLAVGDTIASS